METATKFDESKLSMFCNPDISLYDFSEPFVLGDDTVATNGMIIVRVLDGGSSEKMLEKYPNINKAFPETLPVEGFESLPDIQKPDFVDDCWEMDHKLFFFGVGSEWDECSECEVFEMWLRDRSTRVEVQGLDFQKYLLWQINQLPGSKVVRSEVDEGDGLYFTWDHGDGFLMCMKPEMTQ